MDELAGRTGKSFSRSPLWRLNLVVIRNAQEQEASHLAAIGLEAWRVASSALGLTAVLESNAQEAFAGFTESSWHRILVAEKHGIAVGWSARENSGDMISDFWVDPRLHGQGIGGALLKAVEEQVLAAGFPSIKLESHADNERAISFFRKHAYGVSWLSMKYARKLDREVQTIGLRKQLKDVELMTYGPSF